MKEVHKLRIKNMIKISKSYPYNFMHKRIALNTLKVIEKEKGKLSKCIMTQCDSYAKNTLGDIKYAPWLYVYSALQGKFKEGWMPDNYYGEVVKRDIDGSFSAPSECKPLSNRILKTNKLPDLLYVNNGLFIEPVNYKIIPASTAFDILFSKDDTVIFKSNNSSQGIGVRFYAKNEWDVEEIKNESGVFQKIIKQHEFFNNIFPHPGATIRITTTLDSNGKPTVRTAYVRLGRMNDNSLSKHVQCKSEVKVAINIENGELYTTGYMPNWSSTELHPDTGVRFEGLTVPSFRDACIEVENLHSNYPFVQCIGWDVIINDNEKIEIMEWNAMHNDIKFSEAVQGPCFIDLVNRTSSK